MFTSWLTCTFLLVNTNSFAQELENSSSKSIEDSITEYNALSYQYWSSNPDSGVIFAKKAVEMAHKLKNDSTIAAAYMALGASYYGKGENTLMRQAYFDALNHAQASESRHIIGKSYANIGLSYLTSKDSVKALEYIKKGISYEDPEYQSEVLRLNVGTIYASQREFDSALVYIKDGIQLAEAHKNDRIYAMLQSSLSEIAYNKGQYQKCLSIIRNTENQYNIKDKFITTLFLLTKGRAYTKLKNYDKAEEALQMAKKLSIEGGYTNLEAEACGEQYLLYKIIGKHEQSLQALERQNELEKNAFETEHAKQVAEMAAKYEQAVMSRENKLQEQELALQANEIEQQKIIQVIFLFIIAAAIYIAIYLYRHNLQKKRLNLALKEQKNEVLAQAEELQQLNEEISAQKEYVEKNNQKLSHSYQKITDSIQAAKAMQEAMLPTTALTQLKKPSCFVLFEPKDIVSGDVYWVSKDKSMIAVIDCTGHGVPGAFMSMLALSSLDDLVNSLNIKEPAEVLNRLQQRVHTAFEKTGNTYDGGMDIILCKFDYLNNPQVKVTFAGAKRPLYYFNDGQLYRHKNCKSSINTKAKNKFKHFEFRQHELTLQEGDLLYLTTDGYMDAASPDRKKLSTRVFESIVTVNANKPLQEQQQELVRVLEAHRKGMELRDDITIVGVKL
ncbi:hypothetical protein GCM10023331_01970 [Algivirga pacifica]|uniref:PPM-type phosphatase domain-containing protein n=2 Tax=Algivirga pacifica TaxID=1162670 RepID=A0ABP9CXE3_9BACT